MSREQVVQKIKEHMGSGNFLNKKDIKELSPIIQDLTANYKEEYDIQKLNKAKELGYKVLEIWSSDSVEHNVCKCLDFINDNIKDEIWK